MTPDPDDVLELFVSFWTARTVMAAVEMGVFEALEGTALDTEQARSALGDLPDRPARALLDTCAAAGLLTKHDGRYRNSAAASRYLHRDSEYSLRNYVLDERWCWGAWGDLEEALRSDAQRLPADGDGYHSFPEEFLYDFLHGHTLVMAERLAGAVDLSGASTVMDVGGGSGAASISLCRANPHLRAVVVDRAEVLARSAAHIERAGLKARIRTAPANIFTDTLPEGCDIVLLANVLHDFSPEKARLLIGRAARALPARGRIVLMEIVPDDDRTGPLLPVTFAAAMVVNTEGGDAHTAPSYLEWLGSAGFSDLMVHPLPGRMVTAAIEGRKIT